MMKKMNKSEVILAFDKETVRSFDKDGRMKVAVSRISKADVNPYWGREIVGGEELGLDPDHVYNVFRRPRSCAAPHPHSTSCPFSPFTNTSVQKTRKKN